MGKVGSNAGGVDNIVESKLVNEGAGLEEQRQRLSNTARSTSNDCARITG